MKDVSLKLGNEWVHEHLSLTVEPDRIVALMGDSGCGKTTLMREILRLQYIHSGSIYFKGQCVQGIDVKDSFELTRLLTSKIAMMFQTGALFTSMTVLENVMFPLQEFSNFSKKDMKALASIKLHMVGLDASAFSKYPAQLSGGMIKRTAIARTLILDPEVLFLDEPTAGLDPLGADAFDQMILQLQQNLKLTILMVTHDVSSVINIVDEVVYMGDKRILYHDSVKKARNNTEIPKLKKFFDRVRM